MNRAIVIKRQTKTQWAKILQSSMGGLNSTGSSAAVYCSDTLFIMQVLYRIIYCDDNVVMMPKGREQVLSSTWGANKEDTWARNPFSESLY